MSNKALLRIIVLFAVSLLLMVIGRFSSFSEYFTLDGLELAIKDAGSYGMVVFVLLYTIGILMNIPGVLFLFVGFMVYDGFTGIAIGYIASLVAVIIHFYFVRMFGGDAMTEIKHPLIIKQRKRLELHPIKTTFILRMILYVSPPINYGLALSPIRFRDFLIGTMISFPLNVLMNYALWHFAKDVWVHWFV